MVLAIDSEGGDNEQVEDDKYSEEEEEFSFEEDDYSEENCKQLLKDITEYYGLWKHIGLELGVDADVITDIERDYKGDSNRLHAMIKQWPHSDNPSLTYRTLKKAYESGRVFIAIMGIAIIYVIDSYTIIIA